MAGLLASVIPFTGRSAVVINEVQSSNDETPVVDDVGEAMDWVELHNDGGKEVDISGWGFSDKGKKDPFKWTFPNGTKIGARGYLVVICDKTATSKTYPVAPFGLSADGETLTLTDAATNKVDEVEFGAIPTDCSFGRAGGELKYFAEPTPGRANAAESYGAPVTEPVVFSQERGVFTGKTNVKVTLSHPNAAATIYYTTDHSDPSPTNGKEYSGEEIAISKTTIVRATAVVPGSLPCRNITSQSYIFLDQVVDQKQPDAADDFWTDEHYCSGCGRVISGAKAGCPACYDISKTVLTNDTARQDFVKALQAGTVLSVTMSDEEMFDPKTGMHSHPKSIDIDRAASVEWVTGNHVFGTQCGVCAHGGWARQFEITPKISFRLKFRARFGASKLEVPVMDDVGCAQAEFKTLVLRGENNLSWGRYSKRGTSMRDQVVRDLQGEMSGYHSRGTHVHLFINGLYWGVYNICEAGDADWAAMASGWGGEDTDYDVLKHDDGSPEDSEDGIRGFKISDGTATDYTNLIKFVQSCKKNNTVSQADYEEICRRVDIDAYIDYMILQCYIYNGDWPNNNWVAILSTRIGQPLRYLAWDVEDSLRNDKVTSNLLSANATYVWTSEKIQRVLEYSAEYKLRFADRVHRHFYGNGALTEASLKARYEERAKMVRPMIFAEVARWGAYHPDHLSYRKNGWTGFDVHYQDINDGYKTAFTMKHWDDEYNNIMTFFSKRWSNFKSQLKDKGLYPSVEAADFQKTDDLSVKITSIPSGATVYYTTDGSDPRVAFTGGIHGSKYAAGQTITVADTATVKARAYVSTSKTWSALSEIELVNPILPTNEFIPTDNGKNWDADANWTRGYYPNAAGETAVIGVPTEVKSADKTWRNIKIGSDVTVGAVEVTNGGWTNRLTGAGSLTFLGEISEDGATTNDAAFVVTDQSGAGLAMIDLDDPGVIRLESDTTLVVSNAVGTADCGGLRIEGTIVGNGHNLKKSGPGRLTLACSATGIDKLQCEEGIVAIEKPITVTSITKKGPVWLKMDEAVVCADKLSADAVGLFVETEIGGTTAYGGAVAVNSLTKPKECTVYIPAAEGTVRFCDRSWKVCDNATVEEATTDDGRKTYKVFVPYQQPLVTVGGEAFCSVQEALDAANTAKPLVFAVTPVVAGSTVTANGDAGVVKDYYDVEQAGDTLTLKLNEKARPEPNTFSEITWFAGRMTTQKRCGFLTKPGFYYALGQDGIARTGWIVGDGTPQFIEGDAGWDVLVSDVPR